MKIIKLDAIDSTNSFLKNLSVNATVQDFTIVVAKQQTSGRGQMNAEWVVEGGKNLTFSVFSCFDDLPISNQKYLNFSVSLAVFEVLNDLFLPKLTIKWPNDILSVNKKLAGILIENNLKGNKISSSIIGIGINVNQQKFSKDLPNATSVKKILSKEFDLDILLNEVLIRLKEKLDLFKK